MALTLRSAVVGDVGMPFYQGRTTPPCKYNIARAPTQSGVMGTSSLPSSLAETCRLPLLRRAPKNGNALQSLPEKTRHAIDNQLLTGVSITRYAM